MRGSMMANVECALLRWRQVRYSSTIHRFLVHPYEWLRSRFYYIKSLSAKNLDNSGTNIAMCAQSSLTMK